MRSFQRLLIASIILLAGLALTPYIALPSGKFSWQQFADVYQPSPTAVVRIKNFAYDPSTVIVPVGAIVRWVNEDNVTHTVTSVSGNELNSGNIAGGGVFEHQFTQAGTYTYICAIHTNMTGKVIVSQQFDALFFPFIAR